MTIQWYPGHMVKAQRQIKEKLKMVDVIIELVDARIPYASRNPLVDDLISGKPRLILLNKEDMADPVVTDAWRQYYNSVGWETLTVDSQKGKHVKRIPELVRALDQEKQKLREKKGVLHHTARALILGIPNVGKSTLINRLANRRATQIGDKPGVTKGQQWIKVGGAMELLDTPGILWPKFETEAIGLKLATTGAIKDNLIDFQELAVFLLRHLYDHYVDRLKERYQLVDVPNPWEDIVALFDVIGKKRGCLMAGGVVDYDKTAEIIIRDFRSQKFGRVSLEHPDDIKHA